MLIAKNRLGPDGIVLPMFIDTANVDLKMYEPMNKVEDELSASDKLKRLREKYQKFNSEKKQ